LLSISRKDALTATADSKNTTVSMHHLVKEQQSVNPAERRNIPFTDLRSALHLYTAIDR
jgi:hypothetical protein